MATLPKVLINRADYQIGGGVHLGSELRLLNWVDRKGHIADSDRSAEKSISVPRDEPLVSRTVGSQVCHLQNLQPDQSS